MKTTLFRALPFVFLSACAGSSASQDYYRERAFTNPQESIGTYTIKKKELEVRPYRQGSDEVEKSEATIESGFDARRALQAGNERFVAGAAAHPRQSIERRKSLTGSQHPHTAVLSCSDSRVPPEVVFDQGIGDLFVVRTAGEVADAGAVASLEYAVEHLGVKSILIMGHTSCGAVKAALTTPKGTSAGSKDLDHLVGSVRSHIKGITTEGAGPGLEYAVKAQVDGAAKDLLKRSKIIREAVEKHGVTLVHGIYRLESGRADIW